MSDFIAKETRFQGRYKSTVIDTLYQAYRPVLGRTILFLFIGFLARLSFLSNANWIGIWVDNLTQKAGAEHWYSHLSSQDFIWILAAVTGFGFVTTLAFRIGLSRLSAASVSRIYDETTMRVSRLPMSFFDRNPAGRVMTRFSSDYNNIFRIFGGPIAEFISLVFEILAMTLLITLASPWFLPIWFLQAGINYGVYRHFLPALRLQRREVALKRSPGIAHFAESATGAPSIRAFDRAQVFSDRFEKLNDLFIVQKIEAAKVFVKFSLGMGVGTAFTFFITGVTSIYLVRTGRLGVGSVGVAFTYISLSTTVLQSFFEWLGQFEEALTGVERMDEYMRLPLETGAKLPKAAQFKTGHPHELKSTPHLKIARGEASASTSAGGASHAEGASIEIQNLSMRYRPELPLILKGIDLKIEAGERVAIVGKTGSGKTSLVQALFVLYPIETGKIKVGGRAAIDDMDLREYRKSLGYITQEPTLFVGTLRENLTRQEGQHALTDADLIQALKRVQFLNPGATDQEYQHWLTYKVEERGRNLSTGERQLVCMARCLLQNTPVVVLDEATSSVDPRSEEIITQATEKFFKGKTQLLIAHRLSTIQTCDRVIWIQEGRVHRAGTPAEILPEFERAELGV